MKKEPVIKVDNLSISFRTNQGMVNAVRGISYELYQGETLAIVGESGSGKSASSRTIMGILAGNAVINGGSIWYEGQDLTKISEDDFYKIRGSKIGMIFQDPTSALNPIMKIGKQITEAMILNGKRKESKFYDLFSKEDIALNNLIIKLDELKTNKADKSDISNIKEEIRKAKLALKEAKKSAKEEIKIEYSKYKEEYKEELKKLNAKFSKEQKQKDFNNLDSDFSDQEIEERSEKYLADKKILNEKYSVKSYLKERFLVRDLYIRKIRVTKYEAKLEAYKIMEEVGIPEPEKRFKMYPFQFSGGMKQRVVIAIALMAQPEILICDEPTTALDVTIQAQILDLLKDIKKRRNLSLIFITHNLGVVANVADRVAVMYAGKIVEYGTLDDIFYNPRHPYTWALMSSMPDINSKEKLQTIPGTPPNMLYPPVGDAFAQRNQYAMKIDFEEQPPMFKVSDSHYAATWLLHPDAPKLDIPEVIKERIVSMKEEVNRMRGNKNE
jgi:oligopeptide transport system ATP-binding protein